MSTATSDGEWHTADQMLLERGEDSRAADAARARREGGRRHSVRHRRPRLWQRGPHDTFRSGHRSSAQRVASAHAFIARMTSKRLFTPCVIATITSSFL